MLIEYWQVLTGTIFTDRVEVVSDDRRLVIKNNLITMFDKNKTLRYKAGYDSETEKYVFELYGSNGDKTLYMDDNGNLTLTGVFKTGETGARTVIDGNGIQSYDENGAADGFFANTSYENPNGGIHQLALYEHGEAVFKVYRGIGNLMYISLDGRTLLRRANDGIYFGDTVHLGGASGSYMTADGKTITVTEGLITNIK